MKENKSEEQNEIQTKPQSGAADETLLSDVDRQECDHGYKGDCCCNCKHQVRLNKHPWNKEPYKGRISEHTGLYACIVFHLIDMDKTSVISDHEHGCCEMHTRFIRK